MTIIKVWAKDINAEARLASNLESIDYKFVTRGAAFIFEECMYHGQIIFIGLCGGDVGNIELQDANDDDKAAYYAG